MKKYRILGLFALAGLSVVGCHVEIHDDLDDEKHDGSVDEEAGEVCDPYCLDLIDCGALSDSSFLACRDLCVAEFKRDEEVTEAGCSCVQKAECRESAAAQCEGDPIPGVWSAGGGMPTGGGGSTPMPSEPEPAVCVASCQCSEGMACVDGVCVEPEEPADQCETDCDCTSGESCVDSQCQHPI